MAQLRQGSCEGAPHEILDPRDLKYCRNRVDCRWEAVHDPFGWRDKIPLARWGLAELQILGWPLLAVTVVLACWRWYWAPIPGVLLAFTLFFFRDPPRRIPDGPGLLVSPADGTVVEVEELPCDPFIGGPAVRVGIFLSIFNVHLNRAPAAGRVVALRYHPGLFLNALRPASARDNESLWIGLEESAPPYRRLVVRQIAGAIARRIVCALRPGEIVERGQKIGMIKLGSRTELVLPRVPGLALEVKPGARVKAGRSVIARYEVIS
jgi:phosphatidylserine decarboxylase